MDPMVGDYVRFKHKRVEITGTVIKRSGMRIRVQPEDGGATLWKELSELLPLAPAVDEASEVAELQRLFSSGPSSARAHALSSARVNALRTPGVQAAAKPTVSGTPNKIGMPPSELLTSRTSADACTPLPPKLRQALSELDTTFVGDVRALRDLAEPARGLADDARRMDAESALLAVGERALEIADGAARIDIDPEVKRELSALDSDLAKVLGDGDIALVSAKWLKAQLARQPDYRIVRRQDLKPVGGIKPHLTPKEAKRLLLEGRRAVGAFSLGWPTQGNPDPTGHRIQAFWRALLERPDIEAFFWDYPSLYQNSDHSPRTDEQERAFKRGLRVVWRSR